jgi:tetratricopeptide (TPR) repeat protein
MNEPTAQGGAIRGGIFGRCDWFMLTLLVVGTFAAYQPVWRAGFIWDDDVLLTGNRLVQSADGLRSIWFGTEQPDYFPMTSAALWAQWQLWGANPLGYHLVNVTLHALSAVLLWRVLVRLKIPGSWLAAAIFAVHPVNVESVAWISECKNTLALVFAALTMLAYLEFDDTGRWRWYAAAMVAFALALLSKTAVAPLPVVILGLGAWRRGRVAWRDFWRSVPFFAAAAALAVVTLWFHHHRAIGSAVIRTDGFWSRLAGAGWAVWFYLYKAVLPVNLVFIYPRWRIEAADVLAYLPGMLAVAGLAASWRYRRTWGRAWFFGGSYFLVMLLPVLGFLTISYMRYSFVADRWQYFAIFGPIALVGAGFATAMHRGPRLLVTACGAALLLTLGTLTWRQCGMYIDPETLWRTTLERNPNCAVAETSLGIVLGKQGRTDDAIVHYQKALALQPNDELTHYNFGYALLEKGQLDEAVVHFQQTLALQPDSAPAHFHLGNALFRRGQADEAVAHFRTSLELAPNVAETRSRFGDVLIQLGQGDEAIVQLQKALQIQPGYVNALSNLGIALFQKGERAKAVEYFQKTLEIQPDFEEAHINLGHAFVQMGQAENALPHYLAALKLHPDDAELQAALAAAYADTGRFGEAVRAARRALSLAEAQANPNLVNEVRQQLKLYEAGTAHPEKLAPAAHGPQSP